MRNTSKNIKRDYLWNTTAGIINAFEAIVFSVLVTRLTNLSDAGILSVAFAIGNLLMSVGKFGMTNYQVTDVKRKFDFASYMGHRILTILMMGMTLIGYLIYATNVKGYDVHKCIAVACIVVIYMSESLEDAIWREYQRGERLYIGAQLFCVRWMAIFVIFGALLTITRELNIALAGSAVVSWIICCVGFVVTCQAATGIDSKAAFEGAFDWRRLWELTVETFPLFISNFLYFYISNIAKYSLDGRVGEEVQACFGFVSMPIFGIAFLNNMIYHPTMVGMTEEWNSGNIKAFRKRVYRQYLIILCISVVTLLGAFILGIPILSLLYATDLRAYKRELMMLLFGSVFLSVSGYTGMALTLMRKQKQVLYGYIIVGIVAFCTMGWAAKNYTTMGVSIDYAGLMILLSAIYIWMFEKGIRIRTEVLNDKGKDYEED